MARRTSRNSSPRSARSAPETCSCFTDWRGDPDERLVGHGSEIGTVLCEAAERGVIVKGLVWRSHLDRFQFSEAENPQLGNEIEAAGGECLLDSASPDCKPSGPSHDGGPGKIPPRRIR
ncbi:hypothetical protein [Streptomyces sp. NPDC020681]|uniref:hypothetical protein n=1 Tax=Streptomyces sp. NPDC020681 TaxID=3365083 RepID=UPI0037A353D8